MADETAGKVSPTFNEKAAKLFEAPDPQDSVPRSTAVMRCVECWVRAQAKAILEGKDREAAKVLADSAYRIAMPPLIGAQNISDFIACTAYAVLIGAIPPEQSTRLLYAAQVAVGAQKAHPKIR